MCLNAIIDFDSFCAKRPNDVVNTISVHCGYNYQVFQEFMVVKSTVCSHPNLSSVSVSLASSLPVVTPVTLL